MGTSERSFEQVKSILGKLDRNIDAARARRLDVPPQGAPIRSMPNQPAMSGAHAIGQPMTPPMPQPSAPVAAPQPMPSKSGFGRAQPLRRPTPGTV